MCIIIDMAAKKPQIIQQNKILTGGQMISLRARQLVYVLASMIDKNNPHAEIRVAAKDLMDFMNGGLPKRKWRDPYTTTSEIFDELSSNPILLKKPKGKDFKKIHWLSSLGVSQGMVVGRLSADIAEYFVYKKGLPYTKLLWDLRAYKSQFTVRILDLFQRYHIKEHGQIEVEFDYDFQELKLFFGVHEKYSRSNDFKKRVLDTAQKELKENDFAPYWFEYETLKRGKAVAGIKFHVFIRSEILLELIPNLRFFPKDEKQPNFFESEVELTADQIELYKLLVEEQGLTEELAQRIVYKFTMTQAKGYYLLVRYGVNRSLAASIIEQYCSFGELIGHEHSYVLHTLKLVEEARKARIEEAKKPKNKGKLRTTPDSKKGGLAKKVFEEQQHFPSFMEKLSAQRNGKGAKECRTSKGEFKSLGDALAAVKDSLR